MYDEFLALLAKLFFYFAAACWIATIATAIGGWSLGGTPVWDLCSLAASGWLLMGLIVVGIDRLGRG